MEQDIFIDESNYECNTGYFSYRGQRQRLDHNGWSTNGKVQTMEYKHFRKVLVLIKRLVSHLR